jgi:hypothetical protein
MNLHGHPAASGWRPSPEMLADFSCVLGAWAAAYLLRLGMARIYVVTFMPEVLFIVACAAATVAFLKFRGQYLQYRTRFHRGDARRILISTLVVGLGFGALARFFDIEIISRTAIVLAPPLSALFMINWRLAVDHFGSSQDQRASPMVNEARLGKTMVVVNLTGIDLGPIYRYLEDPEWDFHLILFGQSGGPESGRGTGRLRLTFGGSPAESYGQVSRMPQAVIALPQAELATWRADPRYIAQPGHRFVSIESLLMRARELGGPAMVG